MVWKREREYTPQTEDQNYVHLKWREEHRVKYTDIMQTDGEVLRLQNMLHSDGIDANTACGLIQSMVHTAAGVLHAQVGGVYCQGSVNRTGHQHRAGVWVSEEVRNLQRDVDSLRMSSGRNDSEVSDMIRRLKRLRKRDRKHYIRNKAEQLKKDMLFSPQRFWRNYRGKAKSVNSFSTTEWTRHFKKIFNPEGQGWDNAEHIVEHCSMFPELFGTPSTEHVSAAVWLNAPISGEEVGDALGKMNLGKAAGPDGVPVEFFRQVYWETRTRGDDGKPRVDRTYLLADHLALAFSKMLEEGFFPEEWAAGAVSPVPKGKGDPSNMQSYRPITVGSALGKLFSQVLLARLDRWAETGGWRARSQFGFRSGMGTSEATFLLRHVLDVSKARRSPVCAAFVDFKQAYDSVDRDLLWRCLGKMGIHGHCLVILQQMYVHGSLYIKSNEGMGEAFTADLGVKQGDPLSPLLFGLYIDRICSFFVDRVSTPGIKVDETSLHCILYADDLVLLAHDRLGLQELLDTLSIFCTATKLKVNTEKTEAMFFHKQWLEDVRPVRYNGNRLKLSPSFVYLGVVFHAKGTKVSAKKAFQRRLDKARGALFSMMGTCQGHKMSDVNVLNKLFDTLCVPVLTYGVDQWGPDVLLGSRHGILDHGEIESFHATFMRMVLWVKKSTPHMCMRQELHRPPLGVHCIYRCASFWNKLAMSDEQSLLHRCWLENKAIGEGSWSHGMNALRSKVMGEIWSCPDDDAWDLHTCKIMLEQLYNASEAEVVKDCFSATENILVGGSRVRACPDEVRKGFKVFKYRMWFKSDNDVHMLSHLPEAGNIRTLAKFRCGAHTLLCETGRDLGGRSGRVCRFCDKNVIEDELHVLFCNAWQRYRDMFPVFFNGSAYQLLVEAVENEVDVDLFFRLAVNPNDRRVTDALAGYLKKVFLARSANLEAT
jgi:hypothetical protein